MPVQMIELEEVTMIDLSDDALEATVETGRALYGTGETECMCVD
jgi:hypothetical protein